MSFSWKDRQVSLATLVENPPELLIIGGGVVGCSIAAHAARMGINVVVLERDDLASGASGNSTGLAHAGLRYLAQGRLSYVFHESRERARLQDLAPQWVRPFNFVLPVYETDPFPLWMVRIGTSIYDVFARVDAFLSKRPLSRTHRALSPEEVRGKIPGLRSEGLVGGVEYYVDARLDDARFTLGYAQQAAQHGARIITHCSVTDITVSSDDVHPLVVCKDTLTGKTNEFSAPLVMNATGAWIDVLRKMAGLGGAIVQKSKGVHVVVDHIADSPLIMSTAVKGRVFFVIPLDSETSLIGTTDSAFETNPDDVGPDPKDVQELLQQLFYFFPYLKQGPNLLEAIEGYKQVHVRSVYWGIRPLLRQAGPSWNASREHKLIKDMSRIWALVGVKLTAARAAGLEAAKEAWLFLRTKAPFPNVTWDSLPGGELWDYERFVADAQKRFKLGPESNDIIKHLVSTYGTRYVEVMQWAQRDPRYSERVLPGEPWIIAEIIFSAHEEMAMTLNDFLWRRGKWALKRRLKNETVHLIALHLGATLGWSEADIERELRNYQHEQMMHSRF